MLALLLTALMLTGLGVTTTPALAETISGGNITSDQTWNEGDTLSGAVIIDSGVTVTVNGSVAIAKGASIDVLGSLVMENGSLNAVEPPSDQQWWNVYGETSRLWIPESDAGSSFVITIHSADGYNLSNFTVQWKNGAKTPMSGDEYSFTAGWIPLLEDGAWLSFEMEDASWGELVIDRIVLDGGSNIVSFEGSDLDGPGWMLRGESGFSLNIADGGSLSAINSAISGAQVSIDGSASGTDSWIRDSGPVELAGSLSWNGGGFNGSQDDHDIRATMAATIDVQNGQNTGGYVDVYERHLSGQVLQFPGLGATFNLTGVGPNEVTYQGMSVTDGTYIVAGDEANGVRVVEIGYADGTVWTESATISDIEWFTAWGTYSSTGGPLAKEVNPTIDIPNLPVVSVSDVDVSTAPTLGKRAYVTVTLQNTGTGHANYVAIECYDGEFRADISPAYPFASVAAGESSEIELRWGHAESGNATLSCKPLTPTQVTVEGLLGGGEADSQEATWSAAVDASGMSPVIISLLVALVVGVMLVAYFSAARGLKDTEVRVIKIERDELDDLDDDLDDDLEDDLDEIED
jgi:hypothetical protein